MAVEALSHLLLTYENSTMFSVTKFTSAYQMREGGSWFPLADWNETQYATCFRCLRLDPRRILRSLSEISANHESYGWVFGSV
jgi:hypothetical protein